MLNLSRLIMLKAPLYDLDVPTGWELFGVREDSRR